MAGLAKFGAINNPPSSSQVDEFSAYTFLKNNNVSIPVVNCGVGLASVTVLQPIFVGKSKMQQTGKGIVESYSEVLTTQGPKGLWRGVGFSPWIIALRGSAIVTSEGFGAGVLGNTAVATAAITVGATPLEKLVSATISSNGKRLRDVMKDVWGQGAKGCYAGWRPASLQTGVEILLTYGAREANKEYELGFSPLELGVVTAACNIAATNPFDVVKTWIQRSSNPGESIPTMKDAYNALGFRKLMLTGAGFRVIMAGFGMTGNQWVLGYKDYLKEQKHHEIDAEKIASDKNPSTPCRLNFVEKMGQPAGSNSDERVVKTPVAGSLAVREEQRRGNVAASLHLGR